MAMLERWKKRLPKEKSDEELNDYYDMIDELDLERGDYLAMLIAAARVLWPILLVIAAIFGIPMLLMRVPFFG